MGFLGGVGRHGAGLLGEFEIGIAGQVGGLHRLVAGQHSRNAELLLAPVEIGNAIAFGRRLDQAAQPDARAEDVSRIARLAAAGARSECRQDRAVAAVAADREIGQPHLGQGAAQLAHRRHGGVGPRHLPEGVVAQIEPAALQRGQGMPCVDQPAFPAFQAKAAAVKHAIVAINLGNQIVLDVGPVLPQQLERRGVDRRAVPLDPRRGLHEAPAQQRARQVDARQHGGQQALQRQHVAFAVSQDGGAFLGGPRPAGQDQRAQILLFVDVDAVDPEIGRSA